MANLNYKGEFLRKLIHLSSSGFPIALFYVDTYYCKIIFSLIAITFLVVDYLRPKVELIGSLSNHIFGVVTRLNEKIELTGASYVFISVALCTIIFDTHIAIISLFALSICDSIAALIGIPYGKTNFLDKSLEGSLAFLISLLVIFYIFNIYWISAFVIALIVTFIEAKKTFINDNLLIPFSVGLLLTILT